MTTSEQQKRFEEKIQEIRANQGKNIEQETSAVLCKYHSETNTSIC